MEHYLSSNINCGTWGTLMVKTPLAEVLKDALANAPERKEDCRLVSNGYSDKMNKYTREEFNFTSLDTILLDCDNNKEHPDTELIDKFKDEHEPYSYFLWETASSTPSCPKFRAILLLDMKIEWINEPEKFTKHAIHQHFARWIDDKASWFFTPTRGKVSTFVAHKGKPYPSAPIVSLANLNRQIWDMKQMSKAASWDRNNLFMGRKQNPEGWRNLPSVKKCLEGLHVGERDNSLNAACYAMNKNGYSESINTFLDEVSSVDEPTKRKFRNKYKRG